MDTEILYKISDILTVVFYSLSLQKSWVKKYSEKLLFLFPEYSDIIQAFTNRKSNYNKLF